MLSNWAVFKVLCRAIGGLDKEALPNAARDGVLPNLLGMAQQRDLLPALAVRVNEQPALKQTIPAQDRQTLQKALEENTRRNMQIVMQALKLARALNAAGITPTFLKGTAQLLTVNRARMGFRTQLDIDLVVPPDDMRDACQALLDAGYAFYREARNNKELPGVSYDMQEAIKTSRAHHHLPPLMAEGYESSVELHRHFLPRRFQRKNPLEPLLDTAVMQKQHGATFAVPSAEYQIIHMVLGKLLNDGYLARSDFPIREGRDYIELLDCIGGTMDRGLVQRHCGEHYATFSQMVTELMAYEETASISSVNGIRRRLHLMELRHNSVWIAGLLNARARTQHLSYEMVYSPSKLPAYLRRLVTS